MLEVQVMHTITEEEAKALGLGQLTEYCSIKREMWIIDNITKDLKRGNIFHELVQNNSGQVSVWRSGMRTE